MADVILRTAGSEDVPKLRAFLTRYRTVYADAKLMAPELYIYHPAAAEGRNVMLAFADVGLATEGEVVGFAPLFPAPVAYDAAPGLPHQLWTIVVADPTLDLAAFNPDQVREQLLAWVLTRAEALAAAFPRRDARAVRLGADMMVSQMADVAFLEARGFVPFETTYVMRRSATTPVADVTLQAPLTLRPTRLATEAEQQAYVAALNTCFPGSPTTVERLRFLLASPLWRQGQGTAVQAYNAAGDLVGSVLAYPAEAADTGIVDDVFVLPAWRGQGVARALVAEALRLLIAGGAAVIRLEVLRTNAPAVAVYTAMGFEIVNEEVLLGRWLD